MIGPGAVPPRLHDGHKRDFGRIGVIGGCQTSTQHMLGAPVLAGRAALPYVTIAAIGLEVIKSAGLGGRLPRGSKMC